MFHLRDFSVGIHRKFKSNHYVLPLVISRDLEMTQFWSVNYICLVYKLKILILDISEILGNIYERPIAIVFETVFFSSFWRLWKLVFCQKILQNLLFTISFYPENGGTCSRKDSMTQTWLVVESCPAPR